AAVIRHFAGIMDTGTDHIAVTLRCFGPDDLTFGRAAPSGGRTAFVSADIRLGRTRDQKRRLALAYIDEIAGTFGVAREAVYVIFTEHDGEHFQLSDRVLPSWSAGEDPLADAPRRRRAEARAPKGASARRGGRRATGRR
ncbi:MAG TPA: tautomerase family protein, partial [Anaeromyxobacter sp.]